jgi:hypothetical protein
VKDFRYLSGLVDGEGTISIYRPVDKRNRDENRKYTYNPYVCIANTNLSLMRFLKREFGGTFRNTSAKEISVKWKPCYVWQVASQEKIKYILENCLLYLKIKQRQARLVLKFVSSRIARKRKPYSKAEIICFSKVRKLNKRGLT